MFLKALDNQDLCFFVLEAGYLDFLVMAFVLELKNHTQILVLAYLINVIECVLGEVRGDRHIAPEVLRYGAVKFNFCEKTLHLLLGTLNLESLNAIGVILV